MKGNQKYRCKNCGKNQAETAGREKYTDEERSRFRFCIWKAADFAELREF